MRSSLHQLFLGEEGRRGEVEGGGAEGTEGVKGGEGGGGGRGRSEVLKIVDTDTGISTSNEEIAAIWGERGPKKTLVFENRELYVQQSLKESHRAHKRKVNEKDGGVVFKGGLGLGREGEVLGNKPGLESCFNSLGVSGGFGIGFVQFFQPMLSQTF